MSYAHRLFPPLAHPALDSAYHHALHPRHASDTLSDGGVAENNTSEQHIHIHHQRQDPAVFPLNFAEGLPLYFRDHVGAPMPVGGFHIDGDTATALGDTVQHIGK
jgi:hypothetical protein